MKILFAASEAVPLAKTGGLADVAGALPKALRAKGADVRVIMPKYGSIPDIHRSRVTHIGYIMIQLGWRRQYCGLERVDVDGVPYYLVDNEYYFRRQGLYGYGDDAERFVFFSRAVAELLPLLASSGFAPDLVHAHDWQTGLVPLLLKLGYGGDIGRAAKSVYTIHNLKYQGCFSRETMQDLLGLGDEWFAPDRLEFSGGASCMKAGLLYADKLTTVSETYAEEIRTPEYGEHLDFVLRLREGDLVGIVNGIDTESFDPMRDEQLAVPFRDSLAKKRLNKIALQQQLGLREDVETPLVGMVSRLVAQKGLDLVEAILEDLVRDGLQLAVLGTGEAQYEQLFRTYAARYPEQVSAAIGFDDGLARRIYAASDLFLMPSQFEPCGLGQLLALRYRSVPVVRETGGLKDTVPPYNEFTGEGIGFSFAPYAAHDLLFTIRRAVSFYGQPDHWAALHRNIGRTDFSWLASAKAYLLLYRGLATPLALRP
ncbi:glycogen synthase GlgA [Paenibacillus sp. HJGM_3]|uniref:glycogen synthase GlgA n=1 Tax=Paenibacillus sp. HJGM_3 TaxID=3379816 RepID=UPI00385FACE3